MKWAHRIRFVFTFYFYYLYIKTQFSHYFIFFSASHFSYCAPFFFFLFLASDDTQKSHRSRHRVHKSSGSSHKTMCRSLSCDSQSKGSISTPRGPMVPNSNSLVLFTIYPFFLCLEELRTAFIVCHLWFKISPAQKVDLSKLEMAALWRYLRHFNLVSELYIIYQVE